MPGLQFIEIGGDGDIHDMKAFRQHIRVLVVTPRHIGLVSLFRRIIVALDRFPQSVRQRHGQQPHPGGMRGSKRVSLIGVKWTGKK